MTTEPAPTPPTEEPRDPPTWEELAGQFASQRDEARAEVAELRGARLLSILFGHHGSAPRPFALQRKGTGHALVALGAEFPDGAVALRLANDGGWTTKSEGGAEQFAQHRAGGDVEILWLSEELDTLAEMEQRAEAAETELSRLRSDLNQATVVVEAAAAFCDQFAHRASGFPRRDALLAAVETYRAYRSGQTEGTTPA